MENLILQPYSVLMSVYRGDAPDFFRQSLESIFSQTVQPDEVVLVCDGKLSEELDAVIDEYSGKFADILRPVRLVECKGTAHAANTGLDECKNEYIMKMDSDDICVPDRAEKQMTYLAQHPDISILGGYIEEFDSDSGERIGLREPPLGDAEIRKFARRRSPFNNQTLVYKKSYAKKIGGYSDELARCEDYDFMVRMLVGGAKAANLPEVLVKYRVNHENLTRRRNFKNTKSFIAVRKKIHKMGYSSFWDFLLPCMGQIILFITPSFMTGFLYKIMLRK